MMTEESSSERAWAKYPEAIPGTLKLIPPEYRFPALINDYEAMKDMLYGDIPSFLLSVNC